MSIQAMAAAFRTALPAGPKWLLVALGDHADAKGSSCYPSITTLALKTGMTERTVQRNLRYLEQHRYISAAPAVTIRRGVVMNAWRLIFMLGEIEEDPPAPYFKGASKKLRRTTIELFEQVCQYCGRAGGADHGPDGQLWHVDRIVPGSKGGQYVPDNVTLSCATCNRKKRARVLAPPERPRSLTLMLETGGATVAPLGVPPTTERGAKAYARMAPEPVDPSREPSSEPTPLPPASGGEGPR